MPPFQLVGYNDEVLDVKYVGVEDSHVAVATNSNYVKVFELSTSSCQLLAGHKEVVLCVDVFRDGLTLVTGSKVLFGLFRRWLFPGCCKIAQPRDIVTRA